MPVLPSAYNPLIPQATDQLSVSQLDLLNNFGAIQALIDVNHVDFAASGAGKHAFVEMPIQSPAPSTIAGEVGMYTITSAITGQPEIVIKKQLGSTAPIATYEITSAVYNGTGYSRLPSGILLQWGTVTQTGAGATNNFPIPFTNAVYHVYLSIEGSTLANNASVYYLNGNITGFNALVKQRLTAADGTATFDYLAIGV